ncbi:hypothetical protein K2173_014164 [Erythroxylum novogranatense]|uniref:Uncharacterized protein n=1 Tax=Erythroxylum novogranatense TaxID=1862640 RepID=A0AAV8SDL7_9ROSI|nr:hypothetical protein K2173_014164 [Erythroxylum novogranatense]
MKREGRQHGMVRTYTILPSPWNSGPHSKFINRFDSPPTAGMFTRVQLKPTGHSKFTGKCGRPRCNGCHLNPCCKSKDKAKGNHKLRSLDVVSDYRLLSWRVVDGRPGLKFSGFSATGILDHLANDYEDDDVDDSVFEDEDGGGDHEALMESSPGTMIQEIDDNNKDENDNGGNPNISNDQDEEEEDDHMSFFDVGLMSALAEGDDGWCWVVDCDN